MNVKYFVLICLFSYRNVTKKFFYCTFKYTYSIVPHSGSGVAPMSSLSGVELLGFWEFEMGGLMGEGRGK